MFPVFHFPPFGCASATAVLDKNPDVVRREIWRFDQNMLRNRAPFP